MSYMQQEVFQHQASPVQKMERSLSVKIEYLQIKIDQGERSIDLWDDQLTIAQEKYIAATRRMAEIDSKLAKEVNVKKQDQLKAERVELRHQLHSCDEYVEHHEKIIEAKQEELAKMQSKLKILSDKLKHFLVNTSKS